MKPLIFTLWEITHIQIRGTKQVKNIYLNVITSREKTILEMIWWGRNYIYKFSVSGNTWSLCLVQRFSTNDVFDSLDYLLKSALKEFIFKKYWHSFGMKAFWLHTLHVIVKQEMQSLGIRLWECFTKLQNWTKIGIIIYPFLGDVNLECWINSD